MRLEARPPNLEGRGEVTIRTLVRNALRMRPDRIIVGEVRGAEALDMLTALSTGHDGSLCTIHAGTPAEALRRVETLALMAELGLPHAALREQVADAFDLVVCQARGADGIRRVVEVAEVVRVAGGPAARELYAWRGGTSRWRAALTDDRWPRRLGGGGMSARGPALVRGCGDRGARRVGGPRGGRAAAGRRRARPRGRAARAGRPRGAGSDGAGAAAAGVGGDRCARGRRAGSRAAREAPCAPPSAGRWSSRRVVRSRRRRYARELRAGAGPAARALADAVGGGHSIRGAMAVAAGGLTGAAGHELRAAARALDLGDPTVVALQALQRRAADPAWDAIVAGILLQRDAGGDLAGLLRDQAAALEAAERIEREARTATAQARFTARLVLVLPLGAAVLAELASPGIVAGLLAHPLSVWLVAMAAGLQAVAIVAVSRLARAAP